MHAVAIHIVSDTFLPLMISGVLAYTAMNVRLEKKHAGIALKAVALVAMHACFIWGFSKIRHSLSGFPEIAGQDNAAALAVKIFAVSVITLGAIGYIACVGNVAWKSGARKRNAVLIAACISGAAALLFLTELYVWLIIR